MSTPPSPLRIPVSLLLVLSMPPLGALAWIALSGSRRSDYMRSSWVRAGLGIGVASAVPLLALVAAAAGDFWPEANPNPIGLGLLLFAGGGLATVLVAVGVALVERDVRDRKLL